MISSSQPIQKFAGDKKSNTKYADLTQHGDKGIITGVKVYWHDSIVGLELAFAGQTSGPIKGTFSNTVFEDKCDLLSGDFIVRIFGRETNKAITCFGFSTFKGFSRVWGDPLTGDAFNFQLQGHYIKSVILGVTDYLSYIEPIYEDIMFVTAKRLDLSHSGKVTTELGKRHNDTEEFDDLDWIKDKFNWTINEVKIWHDGQHVHGVQFYFNLDGAKKTPGKHCSECEGLKCEILTFGEDEHIVKALIRAGDVIDHIIFFTDKGRRVGGGGQGGQAYLAVLPEDNHFIATSGGTGAKYLHKLSLAFDEII
jgi:hypothetical protein